MSLYITGNMHLLNNTIQANLLGRLSSQLANALGPISNVSTDKIISSIPGVGSYALALFKALTITGDEAILKKIPDLTNNNENSRNFKVILNGSVEKPATVVKSFQWIETEKEYNETKNNISDLVSGNTKEIKEQAKELVKSFLNDTSAEGEEGADDSKTRTKKNIQKGVSTILNILNESSSGGAEQSSEAE